MATQMSHADQSEEGEEGWKLDNFLMSSGTTMKTHG